MNEIEKQISPSLCKMKCPLVLLTGTAKHDINLLQSLFQSKFGYQVFSTYNPQTPKTEFLTLKELNNFIVGLRLNFADDDDNPIYDGLIFVWCGYDDFGANENILITSDNKSKDFKEIQNHFMTKTDYFIGKPKIFIKITYKAQEETKIIATQKKIWYNHDTDVFTIFANTSKKSTTEASGSYFTEIFCQETTNNVGKSLEFIIKQVTKIVLGQVFEREIGQIISTTYSDIYLLPRFSKSCIQHNDGDDTKYEQTAIKNKDIPETLDFKKHWNRQWRRSNVDAAKIVETMICEKEQGLVVVAFDKSKWKKENDNFYSIINLINDKQNDIKKYKDYCLYIIKTKTTIVLEEIVIDGNVYVVDCKLECKGIVQITTQLFEEECTKRELFTNSISHIQKYYQLSIDTFGLNHPFVAISYNLLALTHDNNKQPDKAIEYFEKALKITLDIFGVNYSFVAQLYDNLGNTYERKGQYDTAIECHSRSLQIRLEIFGTSHVEVAWSYINLGSTYQNKVEYDKAIEFYERALQIRLEILEMDHEDVIDSFCKLGYLYYVKSHYDKAIEFYEKALQSRLQATDTNPCDIADSYFDLAYTYQCKADYDKAIKLYEKALKIRIDTLGANHEDVSHVYNNLANSYQNKDEYDKAIECHENALKIRLEIFGDNNEDVATSYFNLANAYEDKGEHNKAIECNEKALNVRLAILGDNHVDVASSYHNLGLSYEKLDKYEKAIDFYGKALKIRITLFGTYNAEVSKSYMCLGLVYIYNGQYDRAIECHETAVEITKKISTIVDSVLGALYELLGLSHETKGEMKPACKYYVQAWKVYSTVEGEWDERTVRAKQKIERSVDSDVDMD
ncbi:hypothetical protein RFI_07370 [Reticulomyxa filosa]|uniref:Uncharacterized protein n=1 Tax=Reticulomyxa filosa TaxID=46433 RepID=X6NUQ2_RETFI|nr:hypothetical protein RFI_07370 [Reticulomyxa filosa]|eukprot:ETO29751.1 hypothetical protein RFI_07370 [Reticulomyxa filosa]